MAFLGPLPVIKAEVKASARLWSVWDHGDRLSLNSIQGLRVLSGYWTLLLSGCWVREALDSFPVDVPEGSFIHPVNKEEESECRKA